MKLNQKTVFFVRHCESSNNQVSNETKECLRGLMRGKIPNSSDFKALSAVAFQPYDCEITGRGRVDIIDISRVLKEHDFWHKYQPELIVHSPLIRARETAKGIYQSAPAPYNEISIIENEDLREATTYEQMVDSSGMTKRIKSFKKWLFSLEEHVIIVVGHGNYFRRMLNYKNQIYNCDVLTAKFCGSDKGSEKDSSKQKDPSTELVFEKVRLVYHITATFYKFSSKDHRPVAPTLPSC